MSTNTLGAEILRVIADEIGGYEVTHPAMRGATAAIHARVMLVLHERAQELEADKARLDWLDANPVQDIGFGQGPGIIMFNSKPFWNIRDAIDEARNPEIV